MDPLHLPLEELLYLRLGTFLDQLHGRRVPDLYRVVMDQVDRAVMRQALERAHGQCGEAARFLGIDRNTFARKAKRLKVKARAEQPPKRATPASKRSSRSAS